MNRRGVALVVVLWLIVLLTGLAATALGSARGASLMARNRLAHTRAAWARDGCLEILLGQARADSMLRRSPMARVALDSVDLGGGTWCRLRLDDPGNQVNLNLASREALQRLFADSGLAALVVAGRPWPAVTALPPSFASWSQWLTTRGDGRITLTTAPQEVLKTLPGLGDDGARDLARGRLLRRAWMSVDELLALLGPRSRERVSPVFREFGTGIVLRPEILVATIEGHVPERPVVARATVTLVSAGIRLAVIRREVE